MTQFRRFAIHLGKLVDKTWTDIADGFERGMYALGFVRR